jgi:hypothetical protein
MNTITTGATDNSSGNHHQEQKRRRLEHKIAFIQSQIDALPGFLPDSYQYLMQQLDQHQQQLLSLLLHNQFTAIDAAQ